MARAKRNYIPGHVWHTLIHFHPVRLYSAELRYPRVKQSQKTFNRVNTRILAEN
jgi:hypothetical protein